jgi:hypothetical protein
MGRLLLLICSAALLLTGCQSSEEKVMARYRGWGAACGFPSGTLVPADQEPALRACVLAMEDSYQAERRQSIARGAAMLGYGSALMTAPAPATVQRPQTCDTRITPGGRQATTTCY